MSEYCLLPRDVVSFPRRLLPIQSFRRSVPLVAIVAIASALIGYIMGDGIVVSVVCFFIGLTCSFGALSLTLPMTLEVSGLNSSKIISEVISIIETPSLGFRYNMESSGIWHPSGPDVYAWDPTIRLVTSGATSTITGPGVIMKGIARLVVCS